MSLLVHGSVFSLPTFPTDSIILPSPPNSHIYRTPQGYTVWTAYFLSRMTLRMIRHTFIGGQKAKERWNSSVERRTGTTPHRWNWPGSKVLVWKVAALDSCKLSSLPSVVDTVIFSCTVPRAIYAHGASNLEMTISCRIRPWVFLQTRQRTFHVSIIRPPTVTSRPVFALICIEGYSRGTKSRARAGDSPGFLARR